MQTIDENKSALSIATLFPSSWRSCRTFAAILVESGSMVGGKIDPASQTLLNLFHVVSSISE